MTKKVPDAVELLVRERVGSLRRLSEKHRPRTDDFTTVVLKAHLVLEQYLTRLISVYCRHPKYLEGARLTFWQKIQLAKAFVFFPIDEHIWRSLELVNSIRNDVAHNLDPPKLAGHIAEARALPACAGTDKNVREVLKTDAGMIKLLFGYCSGALEMVDAFIAAIEKDKNDQWMMAETNAQKKANRGEVRKTEKH
jgi:hypothetical protein